MEFEPAPDRPPRPEGEVHLWRADLEAPGWPSGGGLPADERARANRFLHTGARLRWVASRWALRGVLSRYLDRGPAEIELVRGEHGKPRLPEGDEQLEFNLSHSGPVALIAVCGGCSVGVDVEKIEMRRDLTALAERVLPSEGAAAVEAASGATQARIFYELWARHEAALKCLGQGLLGVPHGNGPVAVQSLQSLAGYAGAVAVAREEMPLLRCWTFAA